MEESRVISYDRIAGDRRIVCYDRRTLWLLQRKFARARKPENRLVLRFDRLPTGAIASVVGTPSDFANVCTYLTRYWERDVERHPVLAANRVHHGIMSFGVAVAIQELSQARLDAAVGLIRDNPGASLEDLSIRMRLHPNSGGHAFTRTTLAWIRRRVLGEVAA